MQTMLSQAPKAGPVFGWLRRPPAGGAADCHGVCQQAPPPHY